MLKLQTKFAESPDSDTDSLQEAAKWRIHSVACELCVSVPDVLDLIKSHRVADFDVTAVTKAPGSL